MALKATLTRPYSDALARLRGMQDAHDVADLLEVPVGQLLYILYRVPDNKRYRTFEVRKRSGGTRVIDAPMGGTAILLRKLLPLLVGYYKVKPSAHGFIANRSIRTNASVHVRRRHVLTLSTGM